MSQIAELPEQRQSEALKAFHARIDARPDGLCAACGDVLPPRPARIPIAGIGVISVCMLCKDALRGNRRHFIHWWLGDAA